MLGDDVRLAWRFALASQARNRWRVVVSSTVVFVGAAAVFMSVAMFATILRVPAVEDARALQYTNRTTEARALATSGHLTVYGQDVDLLYVAPLPGKPALEIPGVAQLPPRGAFAVSPALGRLQQEHPSLADALPAVSTIGPEGVAQGGELYAIGTTAPAFVRDYAAYMTEQYADSEADQFPIAVVGVGDGQSRLASSGDAPLWTYAVGIILLLTLPGTLLLATGATLASAVREHRISLMQRIGARRRGRRIAAVETLMLAVPGLLLALGVWWWPLGQLTATPLLGPRLVEGGWQNTPAFAIAALYCLTVMAITGAGVTHPRRATPKMTAAETVKGRSIVLMCGVLLVLASPWFSVYVARKVFLVGAGVAALGVLLALPSWTQRVGLFLRRPSLPLPLFLVGARLARFPRRTARGWSALAVTCAIVAPASVIININARGDTDAAPATSELTANRIETRQPTAVAAFLRETTDGAYVARASYSDGRYTLTGSCDKAAAVLELRNCKQLRSEARLLQHATFKMRSAQHTSSVGAVVVLSSSSSSVVDSLTEVAAIHDIYSIGEIYAPLEQSSELARWLTAGIAVGLVLVLLAILVLIADRAMTAREGSTLARIGLSLRRRRAIDGLAFLVTSGVTASLGLGMGLLSSVVLARHDFSEEFPWQGITGLAVTLTVICTLGSVAVAIGSNRSTTTSLIQALEEPSER